MDTSFARLVADSLGSGRFALLDVGCSGGIDPRFRAFEPHFKALAVDASKAECKRLRDRETNPEVEYLASFVVGKTGDKVDLENGQASPLILRIRDRLSFMRTREIREGRVAKASFEEKLRHNEWEMTELADPSKPAIVPDLLASRGWTDLDYLKIDIDGLDYEVLKSFDGKLAALNVLGVQLEVNFVGTDADGEHTFHNTDRFMRRQGFELFRLDVRTYSSRALPARYVWPTPAETVSGRPFQGEAFYARDINANLPAAKLAKLAAILSLWEVPDLAAELTLARATVGTLFNVNKGLDLLAAQAQAERPHKLGYADYLKSFEADSRSFYRREGHVSVWERLAAALDAFRKPRP